jgi:hypothetical protein
MRWAIFVANFRFFPLTAFPLSIKLYLIENCIFGVEQEE